MAVHTAVGDHSSHQGIVGEKAAGAGQAGEEGS